MSLLPLVSVFERNCDEDPKQMEYFARVLCVANTYMLLSCQQDDVHRHAPRCSGAAQTRLGSPSRRCARSL